MLKRLFGQLFDPVLVDQSHLADVALARVYQLRENDARRFRMEENGRWMDKYFLSRAQLFYITIF